jgi:phage-related protein
MNKGQLLDVNGGYGLGKDIHLRVIGAGKEIFNGNVALDSAHFLKTNYKVNDAEVKAFTTTLQDQLKKDLDAADADVKQKFEKLKAYRAEKLQRIQQALPDMRRFAQDYSNEIKKLEEELKADPNIQKLIDTITPFVTEISAYLAKMTEIFSQQIEFIQVFTAQLYSDFMIGFNEKILPELQKLYEKLQDLLRELVDNATKAASAAFERAAKALKAFEADFNKISQAFKDVTGGTFETLTQYVKEIIAEVKQLYEQIREQIKQLPGFGKILKFLIFF